MKVPEWAFRFVNPIVIALLSSPLRGLLGGSIVVMRYSGKKSGREYRVPVRFIRDGDDIIVSTSKDTAWWRNFLGGGDAKLLIDASESSYSGDAIVDNDQVIAPLLRDILSQHPGDAVYMDINMTNGQPDDDSLLDALGRSVVVRFAPAAR